MGNLRSSKSRCASRSNVRNLRAWGRTSAPNVEQQEEFHSESVHLLLVLALLVAVVSVPAQVLSLFLRLLLLLLLLQGQLALEALAATAAMTWLCSLHSRPLQ